jgi:DNA-binding CsgD family transcriptional regulator
VRVRIPRAAYENRTVYQTSANGLNTAETAEFIGYSVHSVKFYRRIAIGVLDAKDITEAVAKAMRKGLIK